MTDQIENRKMIIQALRDEFVGPTPRGEEIDCSAELTVDNVNDLYRSKVQKGSGEEIITRESPQIRYTAGVLFPADVMINAQQYNQTEIDFEKRTEDEQQAAETSGDSLPNPLSKDASAKIEHIEKSLSESSDKSDTTEFDVSPSNNYRPCSAAISFLAHVGDKSVMKVEFTGGRYTKKEVSLGSRKNTWWLRTAVGYSADFDLGKIGGTNKIKLEALRHRSENLGDIKISVDAFSRPAPNNDPLSRLVTVCVVNRSKTGGAEREHTLFQSEFRVNVTDRDSDFNIMPYPRSSTSKMDEEEAALDLLFRKHETFAVGHGCSADWGAVSEDNRVEWVKSECFPMAEIPNITPEIKLPDGSNFSIPMSSLAGLSPEDDGFKALNRLIEMYESWIDEKDAKSSELTPRYRVAAEKHIQQCRAFLARMKSGLEHLKGEPISMKAFRLANRAILVQQLRSRRSSRIPEYVAKDKRLVFNDTFPEIDELNPPTTRGNWRPFQIAFILATVQSIANGDAPDRDIVDLIWFPTGGGKTEAYLGLAAFSILLRRLKDPEDCSVEVLMRYTLRLLTAQQFLRASGLVCALENLRRKHPDELGRHEISIGIWLGGDTTPNTRQDAIIAHRDLKKGKKVDNPFMVERCPWCGALMGPQEYTNRTNKSAPKLLGYEQIGDTIKFRCPDQSCDFAANLPFQVVDEDIYEAPPSLIIGTVDKFAQLAWKPEARSIFGIDQNGERAFSPPRLIIQDELHLISGPLGSMVGLYECLVEELCTDRRKGKSIRPKIVCSTATIRRSADQIRALFGRSLSALFPPPGIEAGESFFASLARGNDGKSMPGKIYLGIHTPSASSFDTTVAESLAALLQAPMALPKDERDPWWTLVTFYNTLKELGSGLTLLQSHVPNHIRTILNRSNLTSSVMRRVYNIQELTGRLKSGEVARSIGKLETEVSDSKDSRPVDVCLTSSIMEVGVDIDRLSLMMVVGQPKSTSQYIQITGRVGRNWTEKPGLIVTIHPPTRPRDRSHFEKFRSYHERLYAQVEPTSVTPFSGPALERALHAVIAGYVRLFGSEDIAQSPYPFPEGLVENIKKMLLERVSTVNPTEKASFLKVFERRAREWRRWERTKWSESRDSEEAPLLRMAGTYIKPAFAKISWPTPTSMRNVDAECQTDVYLGGLNEETDCHAD